MNNKQIELEEKRKEYIKYIQEHRNFVKQAFSRFLKANIGDLTPEEIEELRIAVENHDLSKLEREEFEAYRKHFFPCSFKDTEEVQQEFDIAVKHHYSVNDHHPQNPSRRKVLNKVASIHNILDWIAMSYRFKDDVWTFYKSSNIREKINKTERGYIEGILQEMKIKKDIFYEEKER